MAAPSPDSLAARLRALRLERGGPAYSPPAQPSSQAKSPAADPDAAPAILGINLARAARVRPPRDLSAARDFDETARLIRTMQRGVTRSAVAWDQLLTQSGLDPVIAAAARVRSFRRGVLTVEVADSGAKYILARFLRAGGEARLARLAPVALHKVRLVM